MRSYASNGVSAEQGSVTQGAPYNIDTATRALDISAVDASINLVAGMWEAFQTDVSLGFVSLGAAASAPASGAAETASTFYLPQSTIVPFCLSEPTDVHAVVVGAGTGTIRFTRRAQ